MSEVVGMLERIGAWSPYFRVGTGPVDDTWHPTSDLRDPAVRDALVATTAARMATDEMRVAASTFFFGYVARLWSVAIGSVVDSGRCVRLDPEQLLWRDDAGLQLHIVEPEFGGEVAVEVLDAQVEPLVDAWSEVAASGLLWGNTASALVGTAQMIGSDARPHIDALLNDRRLADTVDPTTGRRRSCCLYYRTPTGGLCGDCFFLTPPTS
ncbi:MULTISPECIES: (2Fe-2S)-binding protein [Rhodococcus]|uniref:(2Fe-2S)-binding protein n=1 Tax=Rhodococcus TaxID=1827 RepID=UPI002284DF5E|nr:(2Fe-2S)-binding protein [Rhodococcus pyridinivorans]WAL45607.1 (2Fe-2S)-binding protein [Rhodococcus pyridinivorans]